MGVVHLVVGVENLVAAVDQDLIDWIRFLGLHAILGMIVGHILHYSLGKGQREQNVLFIVTVPIVLFSVAGLVQGLALGTPISFLQFEEITFRAWWLSALVGLILGRISVRPTILLVRSIRIGLDLRS